MPDGHAPPTPPTPPLLLQADGAPADAKPLCGL
jgi:hypothetical protein